MFHSIPWWVWFIVFYFACFIGVWIVFLVDEKMYGNCISSEEEIQYDKLWSSEVQEDETQIFFGYQ